MFAFQARADFANLNGEGEKLLRPKDVTLFATLSADKLQRAEQQRMNVLQDGFLLRGLMEAGVTMRRL